MRRRVAFALLLSLACAPSVLGQGIDLTQGGPIQITSQDGIEWRQTEQMVIARGDARATRAGVTVTADRLIAWYRTRNAAAATPAGNQAGQAPGDTSTQGNEVYRMRAEGNVHVFTQTDQAWGDQATYDLDQAVLVMTGRALRLTTPSNTLTARDTLEYWSQKQMAVARGNAVVVTNDQKRVSADTLVAYTTSPSAAAPIPAAAASASRGQAPGAGQNPGNARAPGAASPGAASPSGSSPGTPPGTSPGGAAPSPGAARPSGDTMSAMAGKLERVEAYDNVSVRTVTDIVTGDRGVYMPDTGVARLGGHVRISRGMNQINGSEAVVNMKTGIATLLAGSTGRVTGLVMPNDPSNAALGREGQPASSQNTQPPSPGGAQTAPAGTPKSAAKGPRQGSVKPGSTP